MRKKIFFCLFVLLFLFLIASAEQGAWSEMFDRSSGVYGTIAILVALTLLASTGIVALVWMFANVFSHDGLRAAAKVELFEVIYSGILFVFIFSLLPMFDQVISDGVAYLYTPETNAEVLTLLHLSDSYKILPKHFAYSKYFLETLFIQAMQFNSEIYSSYSWTGILGDIHVTLDLFWEQRGFINYSPIRGFVHMGNVIKAQIFDYIVKIALLSKFQEILLHMVVNGIFPVFLGAGIILRSFWLTRKLGGLLMAIALSLYFIFPLAYILAGAVFDHVGGIGTLNINDEAARAIANPFGGAGINMDDRTLQELKDDYGDRGLSNIEDYFKSMSSQDVCGLLRPDEEESEEEEVEGISNSLKSWVSNFQKNSINIAAINDAYFDIPARLIFFSLFFSFFGLMATVATIRNLSGMFGGDLEIAGLTHLI